MAVSQSKRELTDGQLAEQILKHKVLGAEQLKAALDYQSSVGGRLVDVLRKLQLVRPEILESFLEKLARGEEVRISGGEGRPADDDVPVDVEKLRVHKKLLEKVPEDLVRRFGILFFFPPPGTRAILMSSEPDIGRQGAGKLQQLLGVEIRPIQLTPDERARWLPGVGGSGAARVAARHGSRRGRAGESAPSAPEEHRPLQPTRAVADVAPAEAEEGGEVGMFGDETAAPANGEGFVGDALLLRALVQLLVKKKLIDREELTVEIELIKRLGRRRSG